MPTTFKKWSIAVILLVSLAALFSCGGGGGDPVPVAAGGDPIVPPAGNPPAGNPPAGNPPPANLVPANDTFNWTGNTRLTVLAAAGLLANDQAGAVIASADTATSQGGAVNVNLATGAFTYDPPPGLQNVADTFTYRLTGNLQATVTVNLTERIWYVRNNDTGTNRGNDQAPFITLAQAQNASDANDTIFVFAGDLAATGQNAGITLKPGQRLLGEGVGLLVNGVPLVDPVPNAVISNAGLAPGAAGNIPVVMLATGNEVAGFSIQAAFNEAILAPGGTGHNLHDNTITFNPANGREGIRLLAVTGNNFVIANTITGAPRSGIKLVNNEDQAGNPVAAVPVAATVTMSRNSISSSAQDGIRVSLDGAGTDVTLQIMTNTLTTSGTAGGNGGIDIGSLGAAKVTAVISRNTVTASTAQAIDLTAAGASILAALVANNALSGSGGATDFRNAIAAGGTATSCLELTSNVNATVNSTFRVDNNPGLAGAFRLFELGNDTLALRLAGPITNIVQGGCTIALNGAALFEANCSRCHKGNGLGQGNVGPDLTSATALMITFQLTNNPTMNDIKLTPAEIQAIAAALLPTP